MNGRQSGTRSNILLKTGMTGVCLPLFPLHSSEYPYDIVQKCCTKINFPDRHVFFLITRESEDEQRLALVSAHPPPKAAKNYPLQKVEYLST